MSETSDIQPLQPLIVALRRLPGVGVKTAQRMAFHLMQRDQDGARALAQALVQTLDSVVHCQRCHTFSHQTMCPICSDAGRDAARLCVVETPADLAAMERTGAYRGYYFVLMGRISPMDGVGAADLGLSQLLERAQDGQVQEVILATSFTTEGEATAHIAQVRPDDNFLCCEVHEPGVGALLKRIGEHKLDNIRILQHDAVEVLAHMLPEGSLQGIHVFFPDPWHKKKHNKRRLIQAPFLAKLVNRLAPGGYIHCATDWEPYAQQMLEVLSAEPQLRNSTDGFAPRPDYRPLTKFEQRGLRLGHGVWDVIFRRK